MEEILNELEYIKRVIQKEAQSWEEESETEEDKGSAARYYYLAEGLAKAVRIVQQRIDTLREVKE